MTPLPDSAPDGRRRDRLGIHSIGEFVLTVPDLGQAAHFYRAFGLTAEPAGGALDLHTPGDGYRWGRVQEGPRKALHHVSFHCFAEDMPAFADRLAEESVVRPAGSDPASLWLKDPDGLLLELRPGVKTSPDGMAPIEHQPCQAGTRNACYRRDAGATRPRRLGHIMRFTTDVGRAVDFYTRVLGMRLSDRSGDLVAFLHGAHGSDHHLFAFVRSEAAGLHHLSWDVASIDAVGLGAMAMAEQGYRRGWGLGRHVLGSNYFHYIRDPWGSFCEYSCGIDFIPGAMDWQARTHVAEDAFYLWGPAVPEEMLLNTEAEAAGAAT